jgi:hypothetical protein
MENGLFEDIVNKRIELIKSVLSSKAQEYAHGDRLSNFNRAAKMINVSREKALVGMMVKHLVSIFDIVDELDTNKPTESMVEEKIGDAINYLILLEAMIKEDCDMLPPF